MKKRILSLTLTIILILSTSTSFAKSTIDIDYIESLIKIIEDDYLYETKGETLTEGALKGIFGSLDPYSGYYTQEEYKKLTEDLTGEIIEAGIGVRVSGQNGTIVIIDLIKGNPAEISGLKKGDIIVSVDGTDVTKLSVDEASALIRGEIGKQVKIGVLRDGKNLLFNIMRKPIVFNPVEWKEIDKKTGYIKISEFNNSATNGVRAALVEMDKKNIKNIVFDVRDNPGGYLTSVIDILRFLLPEGPIVHVKDSNGKTVSYNSYNKKAPYNLVVLTNEQSASASEIFAGAVQDRGVGKTVGTTTYGKGTVQNIVPLIRGGAIKLTVAEYFTPKMKKVNTVGIIPDIEVKDIYKEGTDPVLEKALKSFKK